MLDSRDFPAVVAVDSQNVFWTSGGSGGVSKAPLGGGPAQILFSDSPTAGPRDIQVSSSTGYWLAAGGNQVMKVPLAAKAAAG